MGRHILGVLEADDLVYALILILSLPFGHFVKTTSDSRRKQSLGCMAGCAIVAVVCGRDGLHSLLTAVVNCAIVSLLSPRICHIVSFLWCFGYILFFRTTSYFGLPQVVPHANAVQLLLTLKMVGLAFEVHDSWKNKKQLEQCVQKDSEDLRLQGKYQNINPTFTDMFFYSFCYIGLLTGPYYKYRTYHDMIHNRDSKDIETLSVMRERLKWLPLIVAGFLIASNYFSIQYVRSDEFYEDCGLLYRIFYMMPMFTIFRMRLYIAWLLSECICISATLGAYPVTSQSKCGHGPKDYSALENRDRTSFSQVKYDFETIHNIDIYGCELAPTIREGMRSWNMSVQYWLASNVYRRLSTNSGPVRVAITMMVSAFWHGVHPGYYLSFITIPPNLIAEDAMISAFRKGTSAHRQARFDWFCWFFKMRCFEYMCMGFLLLSLEDTLRYWQSIYFLWHIVIVIFIVIGSMSQMRHRKAREQTDHKVSAKSQ